MFKKIIATALLFAAIGWDTAQANLIIAINQTGANDPVSIDTPRVWNFGITSVGAAYFAKNGLTFDSALFDAKDHKNTADPLVFTLYSGLGGKVNGNAVLATVSVPSSEFNQQYSGGLGKLFSYIPQTLGMGYYSVTLMTAAPNSATQEYFLKQGKLTLLDENQKALDSSLWIQDQSVGNATALFNGTGSLSNDPIALVPEPNVVWALGILIGIGVGAPLLRNFRGKFIPA